MTTEISVMYGSEKVNVRCELIAAGGGGGGE